MRFPACARGVYWWDGEYEGNCELREDHPPGLHWDGLSWFGDDNEMVDLASEADEDYVISVYGNPADRMGTRVRAGVWERARVRNYSRSR